MDKFLSCDWGTSTLRLRLIQVQDLKVIAEAKTDQGIASTYNRWQQHNDQGRMAFYAAIIKDQISSLSKKLGMPLHEIPLILSGMASSTIGMIDLPYKKLPFNLDGTDLKLKIMDAENGFNPFIMISGARTDMDVMRGEETKIVGCASALIETAQEQLLILPGTHSKHIVIKDEKAWSFKSYMTGEFFDLLSSKSVLATSVEKGGDFKDPVNAQRFEEGVQSSQMDGLLSASFKVRTNEVLKSMPKQQNYHYLSGLLIGAELKGLNPDIAVTLVGGAMHLPYYVKACRLLGISVNTQIDADVALISGQRAIFLNHQSRFEH